MAEGGSFNINYITSPPGVLKILEVVFGLLCWALIAEVSPVSPPHQFIMFVSVTAWILTVIGLFIYLLSCHHTTCSGAPWSIIEFVHNAFWSLLYFIASCVSAAYTYRSDQLIAATFFAFFTTACYVIHSFISFIKWRGSFPWQSGPPSVTVNA